MIGSEFDIKRISGIIFKVVDRRFKCILEYYVIGNRTFPYLCAP